MASDDEHHAYMAADPSIPQIPEGSTFETSSYSATSHSDANSGNDFSTQNFQSAPILTQAGSNAAQNAEVLVENTNSDWINKKWRPFMGWMYMTVCIFDFIIFPILWSIVQFWETQAVNDAFRQWQPLTLQGAGLFHMAMGAVLGITAYGRTKEKVEGKS